MSETVKDERRSSHLNTRQELFCRLFVLGDPEWSPSDGSVPDTRGHAARAYIQAGYAARGASARAAASRLLRRPAIQDRVIELKELEERLEQVYLRRWGTLLPAAQRVLEDAMRGEAITSQQIQAAKVVIEQALGPTSVRFGKGSTDKDDGGWSVQLWSGGR